ncbi:MAG: Ig-like domain-containing protein [Oscillospiraceae bacterium]|nr:Ig-like domain-containing protein [Oscillospiraceae bacterium]
MSRRFKALLSGVLAAAMVLSLLAIPVNAQPRLNRTSASITVGFVGSLTVSGATDTVRWTSSNTNVVLVNSRGQIKGVGVGSAMVTATTGGTRLNCAITVTAGRITPGVSSVTMSKGDSTKVNLNVRMARPRSLAASSSDRNVATASWSGAAWDGDNIQVTINARENGTATIRVYAKENPNAVFCDIQVRVGSGTSDLIILPQSDTVNVDIGQTTAFRVGTSQPNAVNVTSANPAIATATLGTSSGTATNINIRGIAAGNTTIRIVDKNNASNFADVRVTVAGSSNQYYTATILRPTPLTPSDQVLTFTEGNITRYMLVPSGYDAALANTAFASALNIYNYYIVYSQRPPTRATGDTVRNFTANINNRNEARFILVPRNPDEAQLATAQADYTKVWEYHTIYNIRPTTRVNSDRIEQWTITDENNRNVQRYMLVPNWDNGYAQQLIDEDRNNSSSFTHYTMLNSYPANVSNSDLVLHWTSINNNSSNVTRYMVVPRNTWNTRIEANNAAINRPNSPLPHFTNTLYLNPISGMTGMPYNLVQLNVVGSTSNSPGYIYVAQGVNNDNVLAGIISNAVQNRVNNSVQID